MYIRLILAVFFIITCQVWLCADDRTIAINYFEQANQLYKQGNLSGTERLLVSSLEFYPNYSESCFLLSRIYGADQEKTKKAIDFIERAVKSNTWTQTEPSLAERELGRLSLQTHSFKNAERILSKVIVERPEDAEAFLLYARTLRESNNSILFEKTVIDALKRFPGEAALYVLSAEYFKSKGNLTASIDVIDKGIKAFPEEKSLVLEKAILSSSEKERKTLLNQYISSGGNDPEAYGLSIRLKLEPQTKYIALFIDGGGLRYVNLLDEIYPIVSQAKDRKKTLDDALVKFTGERILDLNKDGMYEEVYKIEKGEILSFKKDSDQNGEPEIEILFEKGTPVSARILDTSGNKAAFVYSTYPAVKSMSFFDKNSERKYNLIPFNFSLQLVKNIGKDGLKTDKSIFRFITDTFTQLPAESGIRNTSYSFDEISLPSSSFLKTVELLSGKPVVSKTDDDNDHKIDHIINYTNGSPVSGKLDTNADGIFETVEYYANGKIIKLSSDNNNDGKPDFNQLFSADGSPYQLEWDYTDDGKMDAAEVVTNATTITFKFSTRYNGVFDLYMTFTNDLLVVIQRNGITIGIFPDSKKDIYWIGKKGTDAAIDFSTPSGKISSGGRNYFVFNYKHKLYIEEI